MMPRVVLEEKIIPGAELVSQKSEQCLGVTSKAVGLQRGANRLLQLTPPHHHIVSRK